MREGQERKVKRRGSWEVWEEKQKMSSGLEWSARWIGLPCNVKCLFEVYHHAFKISLYSQVILLQWRLAGGCRGLDSYKIGVLPVVSSGGREHENYICEGMIIMAHVVCRVVLGSKSD